LVDICAYELPTTLQNFTQKEVKIFLKVLGWLLFLKHPVYTVSMDRARQ